MIKTLVPNIAILYSVLTIGAFLTLLSTSMSINTLLPGLVLMWFLFGVFVLGSKLGKRHLVGKVAKSSPLEALDKIVLGDNRILLLVVLNMVIFSLAIAKFYTGNGLQDVIGDLLSGRSLYLQYQQYFQQNSLGTMPVVKVPYIMMNFLLNAFLVYLYIGILLSQKTKVRKIQYVVLFIAAVAYLYYGAARGTNFEMFLLGFLLIYILLRKLLVTGIQTLNARRRIKRVIVLAVLCIVMVAIFLYITGLRGSFESTVQNSKEFYYDSAKPLSALAPQVGLIITRLAGYFVWGIYYASIFLSALVFKSNISFANSLFPYGLVKGEAGVHQQIAMIIDPGVAWMPDAVVFWEMFGFLGLLLLVFILGLVSVWGLCEKDVITQIAVYYVFLQMFSLPVGNFVNTLSANKLIILAVTILIFLNQIATKKSIRLVKDGNDRV